MVSVGLDVGAQSVKVAILDGGEVLALAKAPTGLHPDQEAEKAIERAWERSGLTKSDSAPISVTGGGRKLITRISGTELTVFLSAAGGAFFLFPGARTVLDLGAEEARVVKLDEKGNIRDYVRNDRCAAGAGVFIEAMARALKVSLDDFVGLSFASTKKVPINAQCVIFAESEVVSLIHGGFTREDISKAIHESIAERIVTLIRRIHPEKDVILIGGMANNKAFVQVVEEILKMEVVVPSQPEYTSAIGAAVYGQGG
jgi:benzoyl-CoA reductase subunit D